VFRYRNYLGIPCFIFMTYWNNLSTELLSEFIEGIGLVTEEWRPIKGYFKYYEISSFGRVRSLDRYSNGISGSLIPIKGRIMKQRILDGYPKITLSKKGKVGRFFVHRLVAIAFIPPIKGKKFVNHKYGDRTNNIFSELEWVTTSENCIHGFRVNGRINPNIGKIGKESARSKPVILTDRLTGLELYFESGNLATTALGLTSGTLSRVLNGVYKYTKNYYARFA
jgi:hypothetical protein